MKAIRKYATWILIVAIGLAPSLGSESAGDEALDPVLEYYRAKAEKAFNQSVPDHAYSVKATTYYKTFGADGRFDLQDSVTGWYYISAGTLDSQNISTPNSQLPEPVSFEYPNVFADNYLFYFFPNDTGGLELAIGFDTYTAEDTLPDGFAIIDRSDGYLRRLYLYYPSGERLKRYTRSFRFVRYDGYVFPDSIWIITARAGIFSTEYLRFETGVSEIRIDR